LSWKGVPINKDKFVEQNFFFFEKIELNTTPSGDQNDMSPRKFLKRKIGKNLRQR
jgi:hypothetical protein